MKELFLEKFLNSAIRIIATIQKPIKFTYKFNNLNKISDGNLSVLLMK